jgi:Leucine rich repeat/Leucine Rich repeat
MYIVFLFLLSVICWHSASFSAVAADNPPSPPSDPSIFDPARPRSRAFLDPLEQRGDYFSESSLAALARTSRANRTLARTLRAQKGFTFNMQTVEPSDVGKVVRFLKGHKKVTSLKITHMKRSVLITALEALYASNVRFGHLTDLAVISDPDRADIDLQETAVNTALIRLFSQMMPNLKSLNIFGSPLKPEDIEVISQMPHLEVLHVAATGLGPESADVISRMRGLKSLDITWNNLGPEGAEAISRMANLTSLDIRENNLGPEGAEAISRMANLTSLDIRENNLEQAGVAAIHRMTGLTHLYL